MHVALNLAFLTPGTHGGFDLYARRLTEALSEHAGVTLTLLLSRPASTDQGWRDLGRVVVLPVNPERRAEWVAADQYFAPRAAKRGGADVLHSLASTGPSFGRVPRVVTVHDLNYLKYPEAHFGLRALGMRALVPAAARRSRRVIVPSQATRADLVRHLRVDPARIDVVPEAVGHPPGVATESRDALRARLSAGDRPLLLTVSAKRPHKNLMRLLGALARIPAERRPLLVLPGYRTPHDEELRARAGVLGVERDVGFLGWVSAQELENLYRAADVFVFPSLHEGFGLPVLEAMARGIPVATSGRSSLAEVAGAAALLFDPESEASIAAALELILTEPELAARLRASGPRQAANFSWEATAEGTVASYQRALSGSVAGSTGPSGAP
jgi:glycosyltransferase involved in cell wall biosynthesis